MPEGPEIHLACLLVNRFACKHIFKCVQKSDVSKCVDIVWPQDCKFTLAAESRGKELMMHMKGIHKSNGSTRVTRSTTKNATVPSSSMCMRILLHFGMSGSLQTTDSKHIPKHAHLQFWTQDQDLVLSFVDPRRFGTWTCGESLDWGLDRGPCIINEFEQFKYNVFEKKALKVFNKPICELLLDQTYFNGVGNYLRAEALFRCNINPFTPGRQILEGEQSEKLLNAIHKLAVEVVALGMYYINMSFICISCQNFMDIVDRT